MSRAETPAHRLILCAVLILVLAGCASVDVGAHLTLPPTTIIGDPTGHKSDAYDAYELFDRAEKAFIATDWPRAQALYEKILDHYPDVEIVPLARYNLGLVHERRSDYVAALRVYAAFPLSPGRGVRLEEVRLRRGVCFARLGRHAEAEAEFKKILDQFGVLPMEYNEARARLGIAAFRNGNAILAEHYLRPALAEYETNAARGVHHARAAYAEGYFVLGEIRFGRFREVALTGDEVALTHLLREKAEYLVAAREYYTLALRTYEAEWMVAALYRIGQAYELFYDAVLAAPEPVALTDDQREAYRAKLATKLRPVLAKALQAYRRNLRLAGDLEQTGRWVERTRERYAALSRRAQETP